MPFGTNNSRPILNNSNNNLSDFEEKAKEYQLPVSELTENVVIVSEASKPSPEPIKEESSGEKEIKKSKTPKKAKAAKPYYKEFYNFRADLPKQLEEAIEIAGKYYGSKKDYVVKVIVDDLKQNFEKYKASVQEDDSSKWDFLK